MNYREALTRIILSNGKYKASDLALDGFTELLLKDRKGIPPLYRYSMADYNNIRALEERILYLAPLGSMNDIFEGLSCPTSDSVISTLAQLKDIVYIKSFSEEWNNLRMWSGYADSYSGMCVEYDFRDLDEDLMIHLFPVCYPNERPHFDFDIEKAAYALQRVKLIDYIEDRLLDTSISDLDKFFEEIEFLKLANILPVYLFKSKDWEYETEWRFLATHLQLFCDSEYYSWMLKSDLEIAHEQQMHRIKQRMNVGKAVKRVYLGPMMKENVKEHIMDICKKIDAECCETQISKTDYALEVR